MNTNSYDVIVVGSGMGGLTTASILAQLAGKRVLVVERHFKLGGFTHSFRRKSYEWDVGVHYIGDMQPESMTRGIMDLVTRQGVQWNKMNSPYERFVFPNGTFDVHDGESRFQTDLVERFPNEASRIKQYFKDLRRAQSWMARWFVSKQFSPTLASILMYFGKNLPSMTTNEYLQRFEDPLLRAILPAQWPDFGSPPSESAFGFHATVSADFLQGGFYPVGGAKEIAIHATKAIEDHGGKCLVNHAVKEILVHNGKACGVTVINKGKEIQFHAPIIISNAGAVTTFGKLVPQEYCQREREKAERLKPGTSANILFLGLKDDPRNHGFDDRNYWIYSRLDHDTQARHLDGQSKRIDGLFLSFGSLRNPGQESHTAQIINFSDEQIWSPYAETKWKQRGDEYEKEKAAIGEDMLDYVEKRMPGLRAIVDYQELSTPLTVKSFTGHVGGGIYGQACDKNRLFRDQWRIKTSLPNLYLTGSDVGTPGVNGAMMAGVMTAAKILGPFGLPRIFMRSHSLGKKQA
jgi:phytoene dehydrogenase-like protein